MSSTAASPQESSRSKILLESGTNELEVLVFHAGAEAYGINVAKVREVILPQRITTAPGLPGSVLGMINIRGAILPLVDLIGYLDITALSDDPTDRRIIITEFNRTRVGFIVERVEHIHRISWENIKPVPDSGTEHSQAVTGIAQIEDRLIFMLDFESIVDQINQQNSLHVKQVDNGLGVDRSACRVFVAEDSRMIREIMVTTLKNSGYTDIWAFTDGAEAWDEIQAAISQQGARQCVVVTDIEMPRMDGLTLTRHIKSHPDLKNTPVILFSSIINDDTRHKGEQVGADDQLAKPQLAQLIEKIDRLLQNRSASPATSA